MTEIEQRAREFIDSILALNASYGHPAAHTADEYEQAVRESAAAAFRLIVPVQPSPRPDVDDGRWLRDVAARERASNEP